jgi:glycosyltransferase involved in cell wall biosynthesis
MYPKVSIVIPAYNAEQSLYRAIDSILTQTYPAWELIIIDDGSPDNTFQVMESYQLRDDRIKIFQQKNLGPSIARNLGLEYCTGDYIAFVDADDTIGANYIHDLVKPFLSDNKIDLVCCGFTENSKFNPNGIQLNDFENFRDSPYILKNDFHRHIFSGLTGVLWAKLFKSTIIKQNNITLNPQLKLSEDLVFVLEYIKYCNIISIVYTNEYHYNRMGESGLSSNLNESHLEGLKLFNSLVQKKLLSLGWKKSEIIKKLKTRTSDIVLQILMNSNHRYSDLRKVYQEISNYFSENEINEPANLFDRFYCWLIKNKMFFAASVYYKILLKLKTIRREKKIFG